MKKKSIYEDTLIMANSFERGDYLIQFLKNPDIKFNTKKSLFLDWYSVCDNTKAITSELINFLKIIKTKHVNLINKEYIDEFNDLPSKIKLYRGMSGTEYKTKLFGFSWTLSKETAEFFVTKYWRNIDVANEITKLVCSVIVNKSDIIGYDNSRNEKEIFCLLNDKQIHNIRIVNIYGKKSPTNRLHGGFGHKDI